jgi:arsenite methyltransferase
MSHADEDIRRAVRDRYARAATRDEGCCGSSCCGDTAAAVPAEALGYDQAALRDIPAEANLGLGCGNPTAMASLTPGQVVLDLGSGAGIDCFLAARQVGPGGRVIGVDMTQEMISKARANAAKGGFDNVEFRLGEIEALPVADASVDVILSNCVLNLSPEKGRVLAEAFRVLKPGGRLVVSDLVSDLPVPAVVGGSLDAVAGCLPTQRERYLDEFRQAGFHDARITEERGYGADYILADEGVRHFLTAHPEARSELEAFAGSIASACFEASRPVT